MRVKSILNNSALIAFSEKSEECVLIGKGIAFNKRPGDPVDETKAEKVFNSRHARTEELIELLEDVPEKVFEMIRNGETKFPYDKRYEKLFEKVREIYINSKKENMQEK